MKLCRLWNTSKQERVIEQLRTENRELIKQQDYLLMVLEKQSREIQALHATLNATKQGE